MNKPEWQRREAHETEVRALFERLGFLGKTGQVHRFDGAKYWPALKEAGHTATRFEECACRSGGR